MDKKIRDSFFHFNAADNLSSSHTTTPQIPEVSDLIRGPGYHFREKIATLSRQGLSAHAVDFGNLKCYLSLKRTFIVKPP
jgi:hypothetical protein